jgi:membrane protein
MAFDVRAFVRRVSAAARALVFRVLDVVPPVRRTVDELLRVEFLDRAVVIAAQGLLTLIPLVIVLGAFLPSELTTLGVDRLEAVTGIGKASADLVEDQVVDVGDVRTQTGIVGLVITVLSASSFARAVQRMYERVWERRHLGGFRGRRLCLAWLVGWLVGLQVLSALSWLAARVDVEALTPVWFVVRAVAASLLWWWTLHVLLAGRLAWRRLAVSAGLTGVAVVAYSAASAVVMPRYASSTAQQFGTLGLVLTVATWLVGLAGVMVVAAVIGRVLTEDESTGALLRRVWAWLVGRRATPASGPGSDGTSCPG